VLRSSAVVLVVVCALGGAPAAFGQQGTTSNPEELWKAYPLEQRPTTQAPAQAPAASRPPTTATTADDGSGGSLWWLVAVVAGVGAVALGVVAVRRRGGRGTDAEPAADRPAAPPAPEPVKLREFISPPPEPEPPPPPEPVEALELASPALEPVLLPEPPAPPPEPEPPAPPPARTPRKADPVCQVRWNRSGGFFVAVTGDPDGAEREIARSPSVDRNGSAPPEQEPELEVALKVLSKQLRDLGWRPLRARGFDFDERRWYARRFRWPTETDAETDGSAQDPPARVGEQVGMQANKGDA